MEGTHLCTLLNFLALFALCSLSSAEFVNQVPLFWETAELAAATAAWDREWDDFAAAYARDETSLELSRSSVGGPVLPTVAPLGADVATGAVSSSALEVELDGGEGVAAEAGAAAAEDNRSEASHDGSHDGSTTGSESGRTRSSDLRSTSHEDASSGGQATGLASAAVDELALVRHAGDREDGTPDTVSFDRPAALREMLAFLFRSYGDTELTDYAEYLRYLAHAETGGDGLRRAFVVSDSNGSQAVSVVQLRAILLHGPCAQLAGDGGDGGKRAWVVGVGGRCGAMHVMQCNVVQCNAMQCNAMQCDVVQCNAKLTWCVWCFCVLAMNVCERN